MKPHFSDTEMIDVYYLPDDFPSAGEHFATCSECAARWVVVRRKLAAGSIADEEFVESRPATFWTRQRMAITRKIASTQKTPATRWWSLPAVAAMVVVVSLIAGSIQIYRIHTPLPSGSTAAPVTATSVVATTEPAREQILQDLQPADDPWSSEELESYHNVVAWETWIEDTDSSKGGTS